jgi:hypothetical protein
MTASAQPIPFPLVFGPQCSRFAEPGRIAGFDLLQSFKQMMVRVRLKFF